MRWRIGPVLVLVCAALTACSPKPTHPVPTGTLEPSVTESSVEPTSVPENEACDLLTAEERSDMVGMSMDAEVPVRPAAGTRECIWAHSVSEPARAAIRVMAVNGPEWVAIADEPLVRAIAHPGTSRALAAKLQEALREIKNTPRGLSEDRVCEIYLLFLETRGLSREEDSLLLVGSIGSLTTVYAVECENGYIVMAGFGEYGLTGSFALNHGVTKLAEAAIGRVDEVLGDSPGDDEDAGDDDTADAAGDETEPAAGDDTDEPTDEDADAEEDADES